MSQVVATLVGALIAGGFAAFGIVLSHRREHRQWLRAARREAYRGFIRETDVLALKIDAIDTASRERMRADEAIAMQRDVYGGVADVELVGPPDLAREARAIVNALMGFFDDVERGSTLDEHATKRLADRRRAFVDAASRQLQTP